MFERFTQEARAVVVGAQGEARALGHRWVGTEHLFLAALATGSDVSLALAGLGLDAARVRARVALEIGTGPDAPDDEAALRDLGIDLGAVRERVEQRFGAGALEPVEPPRRSRRPWRRRRTSSCGDTAGHLPFTRRAKKALELSLREAMARGDREIRLAHVVLGLMRTDGLAAGVVTRLGVDVEDVRRAVLALDQAA